MQHGTLQGWHDVDMLLLPEQVASEAVARQLRVSRGAVVQAVAPNSAAAQAGLLPTRRALSGIVAGDVIVKIDSRAISKPGASGLASSCLAVGCLTCPFSPAKQALAHAFSPS